MQFSSPKEKRDTIAKLKMQSISLIQESKKAQENLENLERDRDEIADKV